MTRARHNRLPLVVLEQFVQASRDCGYNDTITAISELLDNAFEAGAKRIYINTSTASRLDDADGYIGVLDDGSGMDKNTLVRALQFGGTDRFNSRTGLGRFGMGLPNSSLSKARRFTVFTWRKPGRIIASHLDLGDIISGNTRRIPAPQRLTLPEPFKSLAGATGTLVLWTRCDRIEVVRPRTLEQRIDLNVGRIFRDFLNRGRKIHVNGKSIAPIDPLFLEPKSRYWGAVAHGAPLEYDIRVPGHKRTSRVIVRFSQLPVEKWHGLTNIEKRKRGISKGAGVSILRAGREIDYGWFFLKGKRRENYDDWWRCELRFMPELDEIFGVSITKQGIRPGEYVLSILSPDMEALARKLNADVRKRYSTVKRDLKLAPAEAVATRLDPVLRPLPNTYTKSTRRPLSRTRFLRNTKRYSLIVRSLNDSVFLKSFVRKGRLTVLVNADHPFYQKLYLPLLEMGELGNGYRKHLELFLLATGRTEARVAERFKSQYDRIRVEWSETVASLLEG